MNGVASLGMYDGAPLRKANDALWETIALRLAENGLAEAPLRLDWERPLHDIWDDPALLLAQCCGYPLVTRYRDRLRYVATPCYAAPGCRDAWHRSRIIVRGDDAARELSDLRGRRAAINEATSNSGMNLFRAALAPIAGGPGYFSTVVQTGSHEASVRAVAEGAADVAAIDTVSFEHLARHQAPLAAAVRTLAWSPMSPGLPFVTSRGTSDGVVRLLRDTLHDALQADSTAWV